MKYITIQYEINVEFQVDWENHQVAAKSIAKFQINQPTHACIRERMIKIIKIIEKSKSCFVTMDVID